MHHGDTDARKRSKTNPEGKKRCFSDLRTCILAPQRSRKNQRTRRLVAAAEKFTICKIGKAENMKSQGKLIYEQLTGQIIGAAIEVHKALGPGLLESAYEECLCRELRLRGLGFERQITVPVIYKGLSLDCGYRIDLLVDRTVVVELKSVDTVLPIHEAQLLTYMKLLEKRVGLIINFNVPILTKGIFRKVL
jgi:GxxExxY protein